MASFLVKDKVLGIYVYYINYYMHYINITLK